ncbi:TPA: hypothetical protein GF924_22895 [Escherichia coli]|nr:hypothetical protein [Escherichia coli]OKT77528.1 hypothetical protein ACN68_02475 [Escherichia coli]OKT91557.1 hypothetical protein ACN69_02120 [Escherichia coli]OKU14858.1 hypothetical protein ACN77_05015 [Escherichia coli]HAH3618236.1 hypothetical protein [Escherichia coli]
MARRPWLPRFAPAPALCPASARGPVVFHQGQPAQSAPAAAVVTDVGRRLLVFAGQTGHELKMFAVLLTVPSWRSH